MKKLSNYFDDKDTQSMNIQDINKAYSDLYEDIRLFNTKMYNRFSIYYHCSKEDFISDCYFAFIDSVKAYKKEKGIFPSCYYWRIRKVIQSVKNNKTIRIPHASSKYLNRLLSHNQTSYIQAQDIKSIYRNDGSLIDDFNIGIDSNLTSNLIKKEVIDKFEDFLGYIHNDKIASLLDSILLDGDTLISQGNKLGYSKERVRQITQKYLKYFNEYYNSNKVNDNINKVKFCKIS